LPPLPCLLELYINRCSTLRRYRVYAEPPTTVMFPELHSLYISGENPRKLSFSDELARIAPNLSSLRLSMSHLYPQLGDSEDPKHDFRFHEGGIFIESYEYSYEDIQIATTRLKRVFGEFKYRVKVYIVEVFNKFDSPEIWQKWWTNLMVGNVDDDDDGPWHFSNRVMRFSIGRQNSS